MEHNRPVVVVVSAGAFPEAAVSEVIGFCGCDVAWLSSGGDWPGKVSGLKADVILGDEESRHLRAVVERNPWAPLVMAKGDESARSAVIRQPFRCISKPVSVAQIVFSVERALLFKKTAVDPWSDPSSDLSQLMGSSDRMTRLYRMAANLARQEGHVVVCGERGTGKERLARAIHRWSSRAAGPIHFVDCRTVPEAMFERRVFVPLLEHPLNLYKNISGSTLFLGEVATLSPSLQGKLLTALLEGQFTLDAEEIGLDVRVIGSSGVPLEKLVEDGRFLPTLANMLGQHELRIPALRQRKEDIVSLARGIVECVRATPGVRGPTLAPETEAALLAYKWPGNARELRSVVAHAALLRDGVIRPEDVDVPQCARAADAGEERLLLETEQVQ